MYLTDTVSFFFSKSQDQFHFIINCYNHNLIQHGFVKILILIFFIQAKFMFSVLQHVLWCSRKFIIILFFPSFFCLSVSKMASYLGHRIKTHSQKEIPDVWWTVLWTRTKKGCFNQNQHFCWMSFYISHILPMKKRNLPNQLFCFSHLIKYSK